MFRSALVCLCVAWVAANEKQPEVDFIEEEHPAWDRKPDYGILAYIGLISVLCTVAVVANVVLHQRDRAEQRAFAAAGYTMEDELPEPESIPVSTERQTRSMPPRKEQRETRKEEAEPEPEPEEVEFTEDVSEGPSTSQRPSIASLRSTEQPTELSVPEAGDSTPGPSSPAGSFGSVKSDK